MAPTPQRSRTAGAGRRRGLIRDHGGEAHGEACWRELDVVLPGRDNARGSDPCTLAARTLRANDDETNAPLEFTLEG